MSSFYIENNVDVINKTSYLNEEVSCTEPSPIVSIPCFNLLCDAMSCGQHPLGSDEGSAA